MDLALDEEITALETWLTTLDAAANECAATGGAKFLALIKAAPTPADAKAALMAKTWRSPLVAGGMTTALMALAALPAPTIPSASCNSDSNGIAVSPLTTRPKMKHAVHARTWRNAVECSRKAFTLANFSRWHWL